mgnify:CR=1 FL=1
MTTLSKRGDSVRALPLPAIHIRYPPSPPLTSISLERLQTSPHSINTVADPPHSSARTRENLNLNCLDHHFDKALKVATYPCARATAILDLSLATDTKGEQRAVSSRAPVETDTRGALIERGGGSTSLPCHEGPGPTPPPGDSELRGSRPRRQGPAEIAPATTSPPGVQTRSIRSSSRMHSGAVIQPVASSNEPSELECDPTPFSLAPPVTSKQLKHPLSRLNKPLPPVSTGKKINFPLNPPDPRGRRQHPQHISPCLADPRSCDSENHLPFETRSSLASARLALEQARSRSLSPASVGVGPPPSLSPEPAAERRSPEEEEYAASRAPHPWAMRRAPSPHPKLLEQRAPPVPPPHWVFQPA